MRLILKILILVVIPVQLCAFAAPVRSIGTLRFRVNGQVYTADSTHARGYAVKQSSIAYINGANTDMVIGIEWRGVKGKGLFTLDSSFGKIEFTINHKTYSAKTGLDYLKINVTDVKQQGAFFLLTGSFEGRLQDKAGGKIVITEGAFTTRSL